MVLTLVRSVNIGELTQNNIQREDSKYFSSEQLNVYGRFVLTREPVDEPEEWVEYSMMRSHWVRNVRGWTTLVTLTGMVRTQGQVSNAGHVACRH